MKAAGFRTSEGVVGLRNLAVVALPMVAMCDSRDLGGVVDSKNLGRSTMILYDRYPGGLGYCEKGFEQMEDVLAICRRNGSRVPVRRRLPQLRRPAELAAGHPQRSRSDRAAIRCRTRPPRFNCCNCCARESWFPKLRSNPGTKTRWH